MNVAIFSSREAGMIGLSYERALGALAKLAGAEEVILDRSRIRGRSCGTRSGG